MEKLNSIEVTPNVEFSLKILGDSLESIPEGEKRENAKKALGYLQTVAAGENPKAVKRCFVPKLFYPNDSVG
ncbi:MAG: hypothetical protein KAW12_02030 [Candidatus Aminicenantes bacterium]|nr:hypothetical protein [Candidatus Aminicenantes bacterium]